MSTPKIEKPYLRQEEVPSFRLGFAKAFESGTIGPKFG
jgi:hypothetical protein